MAEKKYLTIDTPILVEDIGLYYPTEKSNKKVRYGMFLCSCGNIFKSRIYSVLILKEIISCGCYRKRVKDIISDSFTERKKLYSKTYRDNNKIKISQQCKLYKKTEQGKASVNNYKHKRRTVTKKGDVTNSELLNLSKSAKKCYWCNASLKNKIVHIDHYHPLSKGGEHTASNLVVSCAKCNLQKHAKDPFDFANSIGKLF